MTVPREEWRPVVRHEGDYEVSDHGRVRSLDRSCTYQRWDNPTGQIITVTKLLRGQMLRPGRMPSGHLSACLGKGNSRCVHVLVLEAFSGPCPSGHEGLHWDDDPTNNCLTNLRWGTRSQNLHDAVRNGRKAVGGRAWNAKLSDADIPKIRSLFGSETCSAIGRRYGVSETTIRQIKNGQTWAGNKELAA